MASMELFICYERDASFQGGALAVSRFSQQLEPTWQAVWGHKAEEREVRQLEISLRDQDKTELEIYFHRRVVPVVLLWWEDVKSAAFPESHVEFFGKLERLTGTPPIVAFAGHAESRGGIEMCSPEITNIVRTSASGNRLSSMQMVSFHQRMNRCQQNMFFSVFAKIACNDVVTPAPVEGITVLSEDDGSLQNFCEHLRDCMSEAGFEKKPVKKICIMSREEEFSLSAKALYIVVVRGDGSVIASNSPDGDYRMILHRILFQTGRVPIIALSGQESAAKKLQEIAQLPSMCIYMQRASSFSENPNSSQISWLVSALKSEMDRKSAPAAVPEHTEEAPRPVPSATDPANTLPSASHISLVSQDKKPVTGSPQRSLTGPKLQTHIPDDRTTTVEKQLSDVRHQIQMLQIQGLQEGEEENGEGTKCLPSATSPHTATHPPRREISVFPAGASKVSHPPSPNKQTRLVDAMEAAWGTLPPSPSVSDVETALHAVISRGGRPAMDEPANEGVFESLLADIQEAQPASNSYTDILIAKQKAPLPFSAAVSEHNSGGKRVFTPAELETAKSSSFVDAWSHLEKLKLDHERVLKAEHERSSTTGSNDDNMVAKANAIVLKAEADRQELIRMMKMREDIEAQNARLEQLKQDTQLRAEAARAEAERRAALAEKELQFRKEATERAVADARYRELELMAMNPGVQHLACQLTSVNATDNEVIKQVPDIIPESSMRTSSHLTTNHPTVLDSSSVRTKTPRGPWVPALAALDQSTPTIHISNRDDKLTCQGDKDASASSTVNTEQRANLEKINAEIEEMTNIMCMNFPCAGVSENQLRQSALSDHETLPHERSPQDERDASTTAIVEKVVSIQRSRAPLAATSASSDSPARFETPSKGNEPMAFITPRVLIPVDRDSPRKKDVARGGSTNTPRVISRRQSSSDISQDAAPVALSAAVPRVLSHRPSAHSTPMGTPMGTPLGSPRLRQSDDPPVAEKEWLGDFDASNQGFLLPIEMPSSPRAKSTRSTRSSWSGSLFSSGTGDLAHVGIGLSLTFDDETRQHIVTSIESSSAAAKTLIVVGDIVCSIDGKETQGMDEATANFMLLGAVHSAVILSVKPGGAPNQTSNDVVVIRAPPSNVASRVASTDNETKPFGSVHEHAQVNSEPHSSNGPTGLLWASLRAEADVFLESQENQPEPGSSSLDPANPFRICESGLENGAAPQGGQAWQPAALGNAHAMMQQQHQIRPSHSQMNGSNLSGDTIRAVPVDRVRSSYADGVAGTGHIPPNAATHMHAQIGSNHQQARMHQQPWHSVGPNPRYPPHMRPQQHGMPHPMQHPGGGLAAELKATAERSTALWIQNDRSSARHSGGDSAPVEFGNHIPPPGFGGGGASINRHNNQPPTLMPRPSGNVMQPQCHTGGEKSAPVEFGPIQIPSQGFGGGGANINQHNNQPPSHAMQPQGPTGGENKFDAWMQHMERSMSRGQSAVCASAKVSVTFSMPQLSKAQATASYTPAGVHKTGNAQAPAEMSDYEPLPQRPIQEQAGLQEGQECSQADKKYNSSASDKISNHSSLRSGEDFDIVDVPQDPDVNDIDVPEHPDSNDIIDIPLVESNRKTMSQADSLGSKPPTIETAPPASNPVESLSSLPPTKTRSVETVSNLASLPPTQARSVERGSFGFQLVPVADKKLEMGGDYYGIRVSCLEQEGPARLIGRVIKGDYLLCVNGASMRGKEVGEALDAISAAPAKCTFEFLDSKARSKYTVVLGRETKGREDIFKERLERIRAGPHLDMTYLDNLRRSCAQCAKEKEDRPSFVVCGFPGVGKSSLINTILAAINSSDYSVADASTPTMEYTRYEQVLRGADENPFMIADTVGLTGDDAVFQSLRNVLKGRHKNNRKMDNAWGSKKASADVRKRAHGLILVADVSQKVSSSIVAALNEMCEEDDLPVVVAWTNIRDQPVQSILERVRSMLARFPRAVNFPVLHYTQGQSNVATVDYTVLAMFYYLRAQSERYMKYGQQEAAVKL